MRIELNLPVKDKPITQEWEKDEQFVIKDTVKQIDDFDIEVIGYKYAYESGPKMQLKPQGKRGYVELRPVVAI